MYDVVKVDRNRAVSVETMGTKRKFWFSQDGTRTLFKAEERGTGEDWAEKIASELSRRIGLPHVEYDLAAEYDGEIYLLPGAVCPHCAPRPLSLVLGNQLLFILDKTYPADGPKRYKIHVYTVDAVIFCIEALDPPSAQWMLNVPQGVSSALDVFIGYIALDAWIANQDRHHENWGVILSDAEEIRLAPTFDHGASLARNLSEKERQDRLESRDERRRIAHFAGRAHSAFYALSTDAKTLGTMEAFRLFAHANPTAARVWQSQIAGVTRDEIDAIIAQVPSERMSPITKKFTLELLAINQQRLADLSL